MIDYATILTRKYFGSEWTLIDNDYARLDWKSESKKPTKKELDDLWKLVQDEIENEKAEKIANRQAILDRIGLTSDELQTILG
jgi:hypothetical protein